MRFLHISDVHVTTDYAKVPFRKLGWRRAIAMLEVTIGGRGHAYHHSPDTLRQIIQDFKAQKADHLLVTGDLTGYAMEDEFAGAKKALEPLTDDPAHCTVIPGNHDTYTPGAIREKLFDRYFGKLAETQLPEYQREDRFPFVKLMDDTAVVGLLSARVPPVPGLSYGVIGKKQLEGLRALVNDERLKGKAVLVMVHHAPLTKDGVPDKFHHGLKDAKELFEICRGPRFAVLHGHIHRRYYHAPTSERPHEFGAGSSTMEGRAGYWIIETGDGVVKGGTAYSPGGEVQFRA